MCASTFPYLLATGFFMVAPLLLAESEPMEFTDVQGRKLTARLVSSDGVNVTVSRDGAPAPVLISFKQLSEASQKAVTDWVEKGGNLRENYEISVETGKTRRKDGSEDFDDKRVNLSPTVTIRNPDPNFPSREGKVTVLFLGRPVDSMTDLYVFRRQQFDMGQIKPLDSAGFRVDEISHAYDSRGLAKFGARYLGYAVIVHDAAGEKIISTKSVPSSIVNEYGKRLLDLKSEQAYDRDLREKTIYTR